MLSPLKALLSIGATVPLVFLLMGSDHRDGPNATDNPSADIADLYAWHSTANGTFTTVLTFAGFGAPGAPPTFDADALYIIQIERSASTTFTNTPSVSIMVRFAQNGLGNYAVQVVNLPGSSGPISGPVESILTDGAVRKVYAGLRDDPFFFDLDGFHSSLATGTIQFSNTHDTFAGTNVTAVVLEMALADVTVNGTLPHVQLWATSGRKPGILNAPSTITMLEPRHHGVMP